MRIGDLRHRVELQAPTVTLDAMNGQVVTWATQWTVWAAIWPASAKETLAAGQVSMETTHRIRVRYLSTLLPTWRVKFGARYFRIVSIVNPSERGQLLDLICQEAA